MPTQPLGGHHHFMMTHTDTLGDMQRAARHQQSWRNFAIIAIATTLCLLLVVWTHGQWHLGNPSFDEQFGCSMAGGQEVSIGIAHHCAAVTQ